LIVIFYKGSKQKYLSFCNIVWHAE
jgi:hypothetical protein